MIRFLIIFLLISIAFWIFYSRSSRKSRSLISFEIKDWMKMSKDQRKEMDEMSRKKAMYRKKLLLKEIRVEYQKIRKTSKE